MSDRRPCRGVGGQRPAREGRSCVRAGGGSVEVCLAFEAFGKFARGLR